MIYVLSFLASTAYLPYLWTGQSMGKWAAVAVLSASLCRWEALLAIPFIWWGAVDFDAAVKWTIVALAFSMGLGLRDVRSVLVGFGLGIGVNSVIAVAQTFGLDWFVQAALPAGLFLNKNFLAEAACLVILAACIYRLWWIVVISTPSLLLPLGRAALAATVVGLIASFASWRWRVCLVIAAVAVASIVPLSTSTLVERVAIWNEAVQHLTVWGHGIGSWSSASIDTATVRSQYMHNDWLQLVYELGIWSIVVMAILAHTLGGFTFGLIVIGTFGFPLHEPATAFLSATMLGHLCRPGVASVYERGGTTFCNWLGQGIVERHRACPRPVPLGPTHPTRPSEVAYEHASIKDWMA